MRNRSNNPENTNQNACGHAVASHLGVADNVRYLHVQDDCVRAARTAYTCRSRLSAVGKRPTVGGIRRKVSQLGADYYMVFVDGHVMLLDRDGATAVDTDPRQNDRRKVVKLYGVWR